MAAPNSVDVENQDAAEDEMIERYIDEAVMEVMIDAIVHPENHQEERPDDPVIQECPLCKHPCRYMNLNMRVRVLSCENIECEYPYGSGELRLVRDPHWNADTIDLARILPELLIDEMGEFERLDDVWNRSRLDERAGLRMG